MEDYYEDHSVNKGIRVDQARVQLLSFRLLSIFLASENLHKLCNGEYDCGADILANEYEKAEIEHLILQIAALFRSADTSALEELTLNKRWNPNVGKLEQPVGSQTKDLTLHEACNKIIHVKEIKYEVINGEYEWNRYLKPTMYLYGQKQKEQWKAILDIQAFCFEACHVPE
ncbi:MAG: hypothetical protein ISS70_19995 [Phycisphaerae bacterium]|nr:hypothetical protein [Phycisphaerae bacterium]